MEWEPAIVTLAREEGFDEACVPALLAALEPLGPICQNPVDFACFFPLQKNCVEFGKQKKLPSDSVSLLWKFSQKFQALRNDVLDEELRALSRTTDAPSASSAELTALCAQPQSSLQKASKSALKKLKTDLVRAEKATLSIVLPSNGKTVEAKRSDLKEQALLSKAQVMCFEILQKLGTHSLLFVAVFGNPDRPPSSREVEALKTRFLQSGGKSVKAPFVINCCNDFNGFLRYIRALDCPLPSVTAFIVAAHLEDSANRGPSVPQRIFSSLRWAESVYEVVCFCTQQTKGGVVLARGDDFVNLMGKGPKNRPPPKQALCPKKDLVIKIEALVCDDSIPDVPRIIGGVFLTLLHGVLRWQDLQSSTDVALGKHAIMAKADMKKQGVRSWVALVVGFSKCNWGVPFWKFLRKHDMPRPSFFLLQINKTYTGFRDFKATYPNISNAFRFFLCKYLGVSPEEACKHTPHGPRHFYPTASRQMLQSHEKQVNMAHWIENSKMPVTYDAVSSSIELAAKNEVVFAFQSGRDICEAGEIPGPVSDGPAGSSYLAQFSSEIPVPLAAKPKSPAKAHRPYLKSPADPDDTALSVCSPAKKFKSDQQPSGFEIMPDTVPPIQVRNGANRKVHLYHSGIFSPVETICGHYKCGTRADPATYAEFFDAEDSVELRYSPREVCGSCYMDSKFRHFRNLGKLYTRNEMLTDSDLHWVAPKGEDVESVDSDASDPFVSSCDSSES